jgi:hypothetical protein
VPDTEAIAAAVGVLLPFLVLGWPVRVATLGRPGAAAVVAMLVWAGSEGAPGRPASIIGLVLCLGLLAAAPVGWLLFPELGDTLANGPRTGVILAMAAGHMLLVVAAARAVGQISDPAAAAVIGAIVAAAGVVVGAPLRPSASVGVE